MNPNPNSTKLSEILNRIGLEFDVENLINSGKIGNYEVEDWLGSGGQANVFQAFDQEQQRHVIIKLYRKDLPEKSRQLIHNEGLALQQINSPYIPKCLRIETQSETPFLVLDFVKGVPLDEYVKGNKLTVTAAMKFIRQLAIGVSAVHNAGFLHLDIKPNNVIVTPAGNIKLLDFGLVATTQSTPDNVSSGSPSYMAPEVANKASDSVCASTDVYGVGGVLYFLLTGQPPHLGETKDEVMSAARLGEVRSVHENTNSIPESVAQLCEKALAQKPENRFQNAEQLIEAIGKTETLKWAQKRIAIFLGIMVIFGLLWVTVFNWGSAPTDSTKTLVVKSKDDPRNEVVKDVLIDNQTNNGKVISKKFGNNLKLAPVVEVFRKDHWEESESSSGMIKLTHEEKIRIKCVVDTKSYVAMYSVEGAKAIRIHWDSDATEPNTYHVTNEELTAELAIPPLNTEYFLIIASTKKWVPKSEFIVESESPATSLKSIKVKMDWSAVSIPYQVLPNQN